MPTVAIATTVTVNGLSLASISGSNASVASDYNFIPTSLAVSATITPATLTAVLTNTNVTKTYDGTTNAPAGFTPTYQFTGLVSGDTTATIDNTGSDYNSAHVANATTVTVNGLSLASITGSNSSVSSDYNFIPTSLMVAATVTPATLTAGLTNTNVTKPYDGTTNAPAGFTPTYQFTGLVSGDTTATIDNAGSDYNSAHVANATTVTVNGLSLASITGNNSSVTSDYNFIPTSLAVSASVSPAPLTAVLTNTNVTKVYDSTTNAPAGFTPTYQFTGLVTGDTAATVTNTGSAYNSPKVTTAMNVAVSGLALNSITGSNASETSDYNFIPTSLSVTANITPATLTVTNISAMNKIYNGNTSTTLNLALADLLGVYPGDSAGC